MKQKNTMIVAILDWLKQHAPNAQLRSDSRSIQTGDVFFALRTSNTDGRAHIAHAIVNGAVAVVYEADHFVWDEALRTPHLAVADLQEVAGHVAHAWYGQAEQAWFNVAITGTNGKTSCSQWIAKALSLNGTPSAVVGTLGIGQYRNGVIGQLAETGYTTPDAIALQQKIAELNRDGAQALAIEASSIGLHQGRLNGLHFDVAVLTNLTRDHLDYHGDMANYAAAKTRLFEWQDLGTAVINLDDAYGLELVAHMQVKQSATRILGYSLDKKDFPGLDVLVASNLKTNHAGTSFHLDSPFGSGLVKTQLIGKFNVSNILAVLAVLLSKGIALSKALSIIEKLTPVPGRMQLLGTAGHVMVVIDYAHTPDALEKTLEALQQVATERNGKLWCVFGCGGDRDPGKRPQMGKIAEQAQHVVVTSDNPRTEDPTQIIQDILAGMTGAPQVIEDRANAILYAIKHADNHDVVLLAGKGHETYQDIKSKKWPFSDEEHAALALATVATSGNMKRGS
ncbi:UDP-N-acetylmuramoyl-L-alanyl-D-glutamate--2,6-diaminopimelate ligase [Undibacterium sp. TS12]|uniref:UDP-N-acetylmuramoyl-L-alanyl-D-glutamate--2, 6-diaminopimelate ligase n=1 Tax=Undibacterium sp. TS12 TaxID=2908202 RepID=UPI001F4CF941|nr:UDP-N-acetylmuramoyl-L-alanyl-D-glutamate--2,6-diaminopimelate ligase [Undibacterium sp. TS12]MCH8620213.1 UDP-N-acetylmuramoyl-L-alanyl-D-glutamate--2,6-diaminopimelate ligase [Undibacterium sp. TS12]